MIFELFPCTMHFVRGWGSTLNQSLGNTQVMQKFAETCLTENHNFWMDHKSPSIFWENSTLQGGRDLFYCHYLSIPKYIYIYTYI